MPPSFVIRDALPQDATASLALRKAIFGEIDFSLYAPDEYVTPPDDFSTQLDSRLELFVMKDNLRAIALYERLGFRVEGMRRRAYIVNGRSVDDLLMAYVHEA